MTDETDKPVIPTARSTGRSGRAIFSPETAGATRTTRAPVRLRR